MGPHLVQENGLFAGTNHSALISGGRLIMHLSDKPCETGTFFKMFFCKFYKFMLHDSATDRAFQLTVVGYRHKETLSARAAANTFNNIQQHDLLCLSECRQDEGPF